MKLVRTALSLILILSLTFAFEFSSASQHTHGHLTHPAGVRAADHQHGLYSFQGIENVIAVGDIHGDFEALVTILRATGLINSANEWIGGKTHLVLLGDLVAGKAGSKHILDLAISLEHQAHLAGGHLHALLGNHDLLVASGDYSRMRKAERSAFLPEGKRSKQEEAALLDHLFLEHGPYADWLATRPIAIVINNQLYVHAGLDERALDLSLEQMNQEAHDWIRYFQNSQTRPKKDSQWIVGLRKKKFEHGVGPAFMREFKITKRVERNPDKRPKGAIKRKKLDRVLKHFGARQMVIGHVPTPGSSIQLAHPFYGDRVVSLDTRISDSTIGQLSAIQIRGYQSAQPISVSRNFQTPRVAKLRCEQIF